jgi:CHAD domain-containing protein
MKRAAWKVKAYGETLTWKRLKQLAAELRRTGERPDDADAIHDLRIAIRRFKTCLGAFGQLRNRRPARKIRRRLRELMDLCGAVRNCDIALELLAAVGAEEGGTLQKRLRRQRSRAERDLKRFLAKPSLRRAVRGSPGQLRVFLKQDIRQDVRQDSSPSPPPTVTAGAKQLLPPLLHDFFERGKAAAAPGAKPQMIHKFRLQAKTFRYSLELFSPVYRANCELGLAGLRGLLKRLGEINDCVTARRLLAAGPRDANCRRALEKLRELQAERTAAFHRYWKLHFGPRREKWWLTWLSRPINRRSSPRK